MNLKIKKHEEGIIHLGIFAVFLIAFIISGFYVFYQIKKGNLSIESSAKIWQMVCAKEDESCSTVRCCSGYECDENNVCRLENEDDKSVDSSDYNDPEAGTGCPQQKTKEACEARGCVNGKESCYWSTKYNECKKRQDCSCGGCSNPGDTKPSNCYCSPAPDSQRCAKVPLTGGAQKCQDYPWNTGPGTAFCCDCGKIWTHYDKECCLPEDVVTVINYDPQYDYYEDTACGCPDGATCRD